MIRRPTFSVLAIPKTGKTKWFLDAMRIAAAIGVALCIGCSSRQSPVQGEGFSPVKWERQKYDIDEFREGMFIGEDRSISVKCLNKPFILLLDRLAYKNRFNYLIAADLHDLVLSIYEKEESLDVYADWGRLKQLKFANPAEMLDFCLEEINRNLVAKGEIIDYEWSGNGPKIFRRKVEEPDQNESGDEDCMMKFFLYNLPIAEEPITVPTDPNSAMYVAPQTPIDGEKETLTRLIGRLTGSDDVAEKVEIVEVETQNALILKGRLDQVEKAANAVYMLDSEYPQVLVETMVFEYDDSVAKRLGTAIEYSKRGEDDSYLYKIQSMFSEEIVSNLPNAFLRYSPAEQRFALLMNMAFFRRDGLVRILAQPKLLLRPGNQASIELNTVKYVEVSGVNSGDIKAIDTGIKFYITPTILGENKIMLNVKIEQSEFIPTSEDEILQMTNKNTISTTIFAEDGELINIGGIVSSKRSRFFSGIPVLKDLEYWGNLFGSKSEDATQVQVEFMLRPRVKFLNRELNFLKNEIMERDERIKGDFSDFAK